MIHKKAPPSVGGRLPETGCLMSHVEQKVESQQQRNVSSLLKKKSIRAA